MIDLAGYLIDVFVKLFFLGLMDNKNYRRTCVKAKHCLSGETAGRHVTRHSFQFNTVQRPHCLIVTYFIIMYIYGH